MRSLFEIISISFSYSESINENFLPSGKSILSVYHNYKLEIFLINRINIQEDVWKPMKYQREIHLFLLDDVFKTWREDI